MKITEYQIKLNDVKQPMLVVKDKSVHDISSRYNSPQQIIKLIDDLFDVAHLAEEYVWMLSLTANWDINGLFEVSHGSIDRCMLPPREILQKALLVGAVKIVIVHCHPSGDSEPSDMDIVVTAKLADACKLIGVDLADHIVIGCNENKDYYSFAEHNEL